MDKAKVVVAVFFFIIAAATTYSIECHIEQGSCSSGQPLFRLYSATERIGNNFALASAISYKNVVCCSASGGTLTAAIASSCSPNAASLFKVANPVSSKVAKKDTANPNYPAYFCLSVDKAYPKLQCEYRTSCNTDEAAVASIYSSTAVADNSNADINAPEAYPEKICCKETCSEQAGKPCGKCGGITNCDGTCSKETPVNIGERCGNCKGTIGCDGSCSDARSPDWSCVSSGACRFTDSAFRQPVSCTDLNSCGTELGKPHSFQDCQPCGYACTDWSPCATDAGGEYMQERECLDVYGGCADAPSIKQSCTCEPKWDCTAWSACQNLNGAWWQSRSCKELNGCPSSAPPETQQCLCEENWKIVQEGTCINWKKTSAFTDTNSCPADKAEDIHAYPAGVDKEDAIAFTAPHTISVTQDCVIKELPCSDTDGGENIFAAGAIKGATLNAYKYELMSAGEGTYILRDDASVLDAPDTCIDEHTITEYACYAAASVQFAGSKILPCPEGSSCIDGACTLPQPTVQCIEEDTGADIHSKGNTIYGSTIETDCCKGTETGPCVPTSKFLYESYCGTNGIEHLLVSCPQGCAFGVCSQHDMRADINKDGCIDNLDVASVASCYRLTTAACLQSADVIRDGAIDEADYYYVYEQYAEGLKYAEQNALCQGWKCTAEVCNGIDDDCDGSVDEDFDLDGDGWTSCMGDPSDDPSDDGPQCSDEPKDCTDLAYSACASCRHPGAVEVIGDGVDNDGDGIYDIDFSSLPFITLHGTIIGTCSDGTFTNTCVHTRTKDAASRPGYCSTSKSLVERCSVCGCPSGLFCSSSGHCTGVPDFSCSCMAPTSASTISTGNLYLDPQELCDELSPERIHYAGSSGIKDTDGDGIMDTLTVRCHEGTIVACQDEKGCASHAPYTSLVNIAYVPSACPETSCDYALCPGGCAADADGCPTSSCSKMSEEPQSEDSAKIALLAAQGTYYTLTGKHSDAIKALEGKKAILQGYERSTAAEKTFEALGYEADVSFTADKVCGFCEGKTNQELKDICFLCRATYYNSVASCASIISEQSRNACYKIVAQQYGKEFACSLISDSQLRELCLRQTVLFMHDVPLCGAGVTLGSRQCTCGMQPAIIPLSQDPQQYCTGISADAPLSVESAEPADTDGDGVHDAVHAVCSFKTDCADQTGCPSGTNFIRIDAASDSSNKIMQPCWCEDNAYASGYCCDGLYEQDGCTRTYAGGDLCKPGGPFGDPDCSCADERGTRCSADEECAICSGDSCSTANFIRSSDTSRCCPSKGTCVKKKTCNAGDGCNPACADKGGDPDCSCAEQQGNVCALVEGCIGGSFIQSSEGSRCCPAAGRNAGTCKPSMCIKDSICRNDCTLGDPDC